MNEILFFVFGFASVLLFIIAFFLGISIRNYGKPIDDIGEQLNNSKRTAGSIEEGITRASESIEDALRIIEEIKSTSQKKSD